MISAFLIGLFGSLHCVGMCGPLMLTLTKKSGRGALTSFFLYHVGRISVYILIGVFFGLIAESMQLMAVQHYLSMLMGVGILVLFGFPKVRNALEGWYYQSRFYQSMKNRMVGLYTSRYRWLAAGVLNGALPCGLIYLAAAGAMLSHGLFESMAYMAVFGLGTLPLLATIGSLRAFFPALIRRFPNMTTAIALISGFLLIGRGLIVQNPDLNQLIAAQISNVLTACGF